MSLGDILFDAVRRNIKKYARTDSVLPLSEPSDPISRGLIDQVEHVLELKVTKRRSSNRILRRACKVSMGMREFAKMIRID